jgi:hypothetical protein
MVDKSEKFVALVRLGYAARGVTYMLLGYLALGTGGEAREGAASAYDYLQEVPLGRAMLALVAVGLLAYAAFKFLSAFADILHRGSKPMGIARRAGDAASGAGHLVLAYAAYQFASGAKQAASSGQSQAMAGSVLDWQLGPVLIGLAGIGFLAAAAMQAKNAVTAEFMKQVSSRAPEWVEGIGRAGHAARAVVFGLIGWSLLQSAWFDKSSEVKGLGEAIVSLRDMGLVYTLVAIGLLLFGAFSLVMARYQIIPDIAKGDLKPKL